MAGLSLVSDVNAQGGDIVGMRNGNGMGISLEYIVIQGFLLLHLSSQTVYCKQGKP